VKKAKRWDPHGQRNEGERGRGGEKGQGKGAQDDVNFSLFSVFSK